MIFDRTPKGLNTPLFFSEITVNGNSLDFTSSSGVDPQPPLIGCEGAISTCSLFIVTQGGLYSFKLNGEDIIIQDSPHAGMFSKGTGFSFEEWLEINNVQLELSKIGFDQEDSYNHGCKFKNMSDQYIKLEITVVDANGFYKQELPENPTFMLSEPMGFNGIAEEYSKVNFCLAPHEEVSISCEGATDKMSFSGIAGYWDFYLDDFDNVLISGMANDLTYYLNTEMSDKLSGDFDGYFWIENLDSQPHRFKMVPLNDSEVPNHYSAHNTNPTLTEHDDGSLTFCIVKQQT